MCHKILFLIFMGLIHHATAFAEPWLGSRFSQNCAGCHAPGRTNLPPKDRRCSLSCQGCHVNPNGGGLRNFYGKWNEQRWLRTFSSDALTHKKKPRHFTEQAYTKAPQDTDEVARLSETPANLRSTDMEDVDEALYDRRDRREFILSSSRQAFEAGIPDDDPYREMLWSHTDGQATLRWLTYSTAAGSKRDYKNFLMSVDLAMRYRPIYRYVHLVYEGRFLGQPQKTHLDPMIKRPQVRSLYAMVDDLPYNIFVMGGYYLPLFGHYVPDHTLLTQRMVTKALTGSPQGAYNVLFKAYSMGTAPNVPYLNIHRIVDQIGKTEGASPTEGWAANAGLRFVTLGASVNYSIWSTTENPSLTQKEQGVTVPRRTLLHSLNLTSTLMLNRWYWGLDAISVEQDDATAFRRSGVVSIDSKLRIWREIYMTGLVAMARSDEQLMPGYAREAQFGFTSFLIPGLQWTVALTRGQEKSTDQARKERHALMSQIHAYL